MIYFLLWIYRRYKKLYLILSDLCRRRIQQIQLIKGPNRILLTLEDLTFINPQLSKRVCVTSSLTIECVFLKMLYYIFYIYNALFAHRKSPLRILAIQKVTLRRRAMVTGPALWTARQRQHMKIQTWPSTRWLYVSFNCIYWTHHVLSWPNFLTFL